MRELFRWALKVVHFFLQYALPICYLSYFSGLYICLFYIISGLPDIWLVWELCVCVCDCTISLSEYVLLRAHRWLSFYIYIFGVCFIQIMALLPKLPHQPQLLQTGNVYTFVKKFFLCNSLLTRLLNSHLVILYLILLPSCLNLYGT